MNCSKFLWLWSIKARSGQVAEGYRLPVSWSAITLAETPNQRG